MNFWTNGRRVVGALVLGAVAGLGAMDRAAVAQPCAQEWTPMGAGVEGQAFGDFAQCTQVFNDGTFGHYAYVFVDRVRYRAEMEQISEGQLLAFVIAHEFGHLLLRSSTHTGRGIMRMRWDRNDLKDLTWGQLKFTPEEAETIHAEALLRLRPAGRLAKTPPKAALSGGQ